MITFSLALIFGIERQLSHKPIGFGTFIFVAIGSCALSISAILLNPANPLPLLSAVVTGIGFLGAGALIRTSDRIFGFTGAASIWIFAILGMVIGIGNYLMAGIMYLCIWIIISIDKYFEQMNLGLYQKRIYIKSRVRFSKAEIKKMIGARKYNTLSISMDPQNSEYSITLLAESSKKTLDSVPDILSAHDDILSFTIE